MRYVVELLQAMAAEVGDEFSGPSNATQLPHDQASLPSHGSATAASQGPGRAQQPSAVAADVKQEPCASAEVAAAAADGAAAAGVLAAEGPAAALAHQQSVSQLPPQQQVAQQQQQQTAAPPMAFAVGGGQQSSPELGTASEYLGVQPFPGSADSMRWQALLQLRLDGDGAPALLGPSSRQAFPTATELGESLFSHIRLPALSGT